MRTVWNAGRYVLGPLGGIIVPWVVFQHGCRSAWGDVVSMMMMVQLAAHVLSWGGRDTLLRLYARAPGQLARSWWSNLITRMALVPIIGAVLISVTRPAALALAWMLLLFFTSSFEALVIQRKRFAGAFLIDALGLFVQIAWLSLLDRPTFPAIVQSALVGLLCRTALLVVLFRSDLAAAPKFDARIHLLDAFPFFLIGLSGLLGSRMDLYTMNVLVDRETLATYQVVTAIYLQFQAVSGLISAPFTRELYRMRDENVRNASVRSGKLGLLLLPLFALVAWSILTFLFHFEPTARIQAAGLLMVWPAFAYVPLITGLYKKGLERAVLLANLCAAVAGLGLTMVLVPVLGMEGALFGAAIGQWIVLAIIVQVSRRSDHALPVL